MAEPVRMFAAGAVALLVALGAASCGGGGDDDRDRIEAAFGDVRDAVAERDEYAVCEGLGAKGRAHLEAMGHPVTPDCPGAVAQMLRSLARRPAAGSPSGRPEIGRVRVRTTAVATIDVDGRRVKVPFVKEGGQWKLDSFYGLTPTPSVAIP